MKRIRSKRDLLDLLTPERAAMVFRIVFVLIAVLLVFRVVSFGFRSLSMSRAVPLALGGLSDLSEDGEKFMEKYRKESEKLKGDNPFLPKAEPKQPQVNVAGILGDEVLIENKWYKKGDEFKNATIKEIGASYVKFKWEKGEFCASPMGSSNGEPNNGVVASEKRKRKKGMRRRKEKPKEKVVDEAEAGPVEVDEFSWIGVPLSEKARANLKKMWSQMSDEQKEQAKSHWRSLTDDQKRQHIERLENVNM
jgi:hypothetical protein